MWLVKKESGAQKGERHVMEGKKEVGGKKRWSGEDEERKKKGGRECA